MPLHIVQYTREIRIELGGVVNAVLTLCQNLTARGHRVSLLTCNAQDVPPSWLHIKEGTPHAVTIDLPLRPWDSISTTSQNVLSKLGDTADVIHLHTLWDSANLHLSRFALSQNIPYFASSHGMLDDYAFSQKQLKKKAYMFFAGKRFLQSAAAIHCTAEGERRQVEQKVPLGRFVVIPHYFDWELFQQLPGPELAKSKFPVLQTDTPKVLSLSRLHPIKGADILIKAVAMLLDKGINLCLILAGPDEENYKTVLQNLAYSLGVQQHVHFLGLIRGQEKVSLYQACDLFALPTLQENFGIVLVEAMASKLPLITTPHVDIWPELKAAGGVITERSPEAFSRAIQDKLADSSTRLQLGSESRLAMEQWLNADDISRRYEEMYMASLQHLSSIE